MFAFGLLCAIGGGWYTFDMTYEESGQLPVPIETESLSEEPAMGGVVSLGEGELLDPANEQVISIPVPGENEEPVEGEVLDAEIIPEMSYASEDHSAMFEGGGEILGTGYEEPHIVTVTETGMEFGLLDRKRSWFEALLKQLLASLLGIIDVESGPLIASYEKKYSAEFINYLKTSIGDGNSLPTLEDAMARFPEEFAKIDNEQGEDQGTEQVEDLVTTQALPRNDASALPNIPGEYVPPMQIEREGE